ncbi:PREDICTED: universal stress protein A-like protein isoform X2 [Theobroma cacao]|uniref:Universal stress protein A-like protein isoform X2 n=1 Tax=Theobroma cacao TaxID=3641 RepID=A0AB32WEV1_THECC|nr:PREDICTED: universal stress protein A-like protein isoform X2 [Theobroma cacao]
MRVMVGIDESDESFHALRWTLDKLFDGMSTRTAPPEEANQEEAANLLTLLHVQKAFHNYGIPVGAGASAFYVPYSIEESIKVKSLILEGDPKEKICQVIEQMQVDLLVVGSRKLGKIKRALLGSVSDYCAHNANCPVLIVKPPQEASK